MKTSVAEDQGTLIEQSFCNHTKGLRVKQNKTNYGKSICENFLFKKSAMVNAVYHGLFYRHTDFVDS